MTDYRNPLSVNIPYEFKSPQDYPTEAVAARFQAYRDILKSLIAYLDQYASVQEEIVRQQVRLQQAVGASLDAPIETKAHGSSAQSHRAKDRALDEEALSALNQFFLPIGNGSIQDIPTIFTKFHQQNVQNGRRTLKEIRLTIIPKLEELRRDLLLKLKEIKSLHNDFDSKLTKEISNTGSMLALYTHSIDLANRLDMAATVASKAHHDSGNVAESIKKDPYLAKLKLRSQLKAQLNEEHYLHRAYANLQDSSEQLEAIVVKEIQTYLGHFLGLVEAEKSSVSDFLVPTLTEGFLAKEPNFEWQSFVQRNFPKSSSLSGRKVSGKFIDLSFPARSMADLSIPHYDSPLSVPIRQGYLERKSKFLKSNTRSYYVLTCSYLHEFKSSEAKDLRNGPSNSISLDYCLVSEHSKDVGACKFDLYSKTPNSLMHRSHTSVFKCETPQEMKDWLNDIKILTSLPGPAERAKRMSKVLLANTALERKTSRVSSLLSARTNAMSIKSGHSTVPNNGLNSKKRNSIASRNDSLMSSAQNHRLSSTFSNRNPLSQLVSDPVENGDDTVNTSRDDRHFIREDSVDEMGDLTIKTRKTQDANEFPSSTKTDPQLHLPGIAVNSPFQNGGALNMAQVSNGNTQLATQNQQYYLNQVAPQPQQFYDPILQQFFTINAIPALQVGQPQGHLGQQQQIKTPNGVNPMPQYFPSSPQPIQTGMFAPASPILGYGSQQTQTQPHQEENRSSGTAPYPVQFGESLNMEPSNPKHNNDVKDSMEFKDQDVSQLTDNIVNLKTEDLSTTH